MRISKFVLALILIISQGSVFAQAIYKQYGNITSEELRMTQYDRDKDAEAVILFDKGKSHFILNGNSFDVVFEKTKRIKILKESGLEWAKVEIPYYHEGDAYEIVSELEAYTYNSENGKIVKTKLDVNECYIEKVNNYWMVKKFAFPNAKVGSVLEYKFKIDSKYLSQMRDWEFQTLIPTIYSEYEVRMIPFCNYTWLLQGDNKFDKQSSYEDKGRERNFGPPDALGRNTYYDMVYQFGMKHVPAFKDEEFITSRNDYIIKLDFQLSNFYYLNGAKINFISTWPELIQELIKDNDFGKYVKKSKKIAAKLINIEELKNKSSEEKFGFVLDYVKANYNWNKINSKYAIKSANDFVKDTYGNCAEINLFTIGLLNACGINAFPVWSSTRKHGKIRYSYPYRHFFNYVLIGVPINDEILITDATDIVCLNNRIPARCINDRGLMVTEEVEGWADLKCIFPSETETNLFINLLESNINAKVEINATEYNAYYYRRKYGDENKDIIEKIEDKGYNIVDTSILVENQNDIQKPYKLNYNVYNNAEIINDKIYIDPFLNEILSDNPLKQNDRTYPIDMIYPEKRIFNSKINIPEGYKVDFLPENYVINNDLFELTYSIKNNEGNINVTLIYYFKKSVYSSKVYSEIKFYFNKIVNKGNEKIVLSKI